MEHFSSSETDFESEIIYPVKLSAESEIRVRHYLIYNVSKILLLHIFSREATDGYTLPKQGNKPR